MKSLTSHLFDNKLSKDKLLKIICKSERTLRRYENNPPQWIINIIKEIGNKKKIPNSWNGWYFENDYLFDHDGNGYLKDEIRTIFMTRQLTNNLIGNKSNVISLKNELENKIKNLNSEIVIQLVNDDQCIQEKRFKI